MREALLDSYKKWYSSNIMTLCISSKFPLATLQKWVIEKFSPIVNKNVVIPDLTVPKPWPKENLCKMAKYVPVNDEDLLTIRWVLPLYTEKDIKNRP